MADTDRITMETIKENGDVDGRQEGQGGDTEEASDELWDIFRKDRFDDDSSMFHGFTDKFFKVIKLLTYGFLFLAPLASVIATRGTLQILTNIIGNEQYYGKESVSQDVVSYFLFFIITIPDALRFLKTLLQVIFGKRQTPTLGHLLTVLIREIGHVIGLFGLLYKVAPSLNPLEFTVVIVTIPAVIGFVHAVAYCGRRRKTEYGWNTRKIVKQLLNLVAMFLLLGLLIGVPVIITQNSTVISSKAEFIGWEIASVVLLSTRWIETYSSRNIGKKGCSIPITENQRLARSSDTRIHSIERKMTDSPNSTPNRESHSEEGGPIHGKNVDEDDSNWTTIKPSTEAVGQEIRCSFDKDSLPSRADQNDDNSENSNSKVKFVEKKSEDIYPTCDDTTTDNNAVEAAKSYVKRSNEEPTDQGDNREQTNMKDGGNETKNVEVTSETYIGDENNGMEENASNDEDNSKGTTSEPSTEDVGKEKGCSFDKNSSSSRADQGDKRERVNLKDRENRINNVEVTSETNIGDENNGMEENASNDEDNSKGTTSKPSTEAIGQEKSFSFDKDSSLSRAHEKDENDESNWNIDADKCQNSSDEQVADIDLKSNAMNKAEKIKENISEVQNALKQGHSLDSPSMKGVNGLRRPREDTTKKLVNDIEQSRETEKPTEIQAEEKSVRQTSNGKYGEKKSEDVHPPSDGTLIGNTEEAANSNEKGSNEAAPANQGENRKLTYLKDGENEINNVKISSETNIGDSDGSSSNDYTETDETETSDENSKGPCQIISASDLNGTGIGYENRTERNEVIENKPPINHDKTFKWEDNFHHSRDIKEEKMLHDNDGRRCPWLKNPDEEAYVTDGNEHDHCNKTNQRHYQHSLEGFKSTLPPCNIENDRETEEISVSYGKDILWDGQENETSKGKQFRIDKSDMIQGNGVTQFHVPNRYLYDRGVSESEIPLLDLSLDDFPCTHSQEFQVGTPRYNAQTGEYVHSHPFIQGGLQIYQPNTNGFNQHFDNDDNDQVGIGDNLPAAGGPSSPNDPDRDRHRNELIAKDIQIAELLAQIADLRMTERKNKDAIVNTEYEKNSLRGERDEARRTINTLTMAKDGLIDDVTRLEENIRILEERLHTTEEDNVTKDANIDTIRSRNSELQANCKTLSENFTAAKKKCISLEANQRRLDEKVQCLEKDLEKLAEENTAKSVEISSLKESCGTLKESENHHRGECDKLKKAYDEEKDKTRFMEDRMNSLSGRVDALEAETEQKDRMIHRKESARQAANEAMQKSQDENQVLCEQLRDLQSLQVQLEQEKAKNHAATEQLIALRQQLSGMDTMQRNIHIWWEEYRLAMNERTQEKADYETCRRRLQTLESELVYVKEERDSLRETTRVDQIEKDRLNAHKHDLTTKLQNQVGQITNMSEEVRNRREAMDTYRREKENLKDRSFELERSLQTAERQIEGLRRDISDRDRDILYLRAQLSDVSDPRDGDGDDGGPGHGSRGHGNQAGSTPGETNSGQQGCFPNIQSSTVHYRPQTPSNSVGLRGQQNQGTPTSSVFGFPMSTSFTFTAPSSSSTPLRQHLSGNQGGPSLFGFSSPNSST